MKRFKDSDFNVPYAVVLRLRRDGDFGHYSGTVEMVSHTEDCGYAMLPYGHPYRHLVIWSQCSRDNPNLYGWELAYAPPGLHHNLYELERAIGTLKPLMRALERLQDSEGSPKTFGQYVNRIARVIGANRICTQRMKTAFNNTPTIIGTPGSMVSTVDQIARELVEATSGKVAA